MLHTVEVMRKCVRRRSVVLITWFDHLYNNGNGCRLSIASKPCLWRSQTRCGAVPKTQIYTIRKKYTVDRTRRENRNETGSTFWYRIQRHEDEPEDTRTRLHASHPATQRPRGPPRAPRPDTTAPKTTQLASTASGFRRRARKAPCASRARPSRSSPCPRRGAACRAGSSGWWPWSAS